jgi:hypothetical protein
VGVPIVKSIILIGYGAVRTLMGYGETKTLRRPGRTYILKPDN